MACHKYKNRITFSTKEAFYVRKKIGNREFSLLSIRKTETGITVLLYHGEV
jgi:hypothetical protein